MSKVLGDSSTIDSPTSIQIPQNAQQMPLLEAPTNSNPTPKKDSPDLAMVDGTALSNENDAIDASSSEVAADINDGSSDQISLYTVRPGDTLPQIAGMYDVTVNTILWANDMKKGQVITPGQVLVILPITGVQYTVKKGDTLKSIATAYNGDADDIAQYNGIDNSGLTVGDQIIIPNGELSTPAKTTTTSKTTNKTTKSSSSSTSAGSTSGVKIQKGFASPLGGSMTDPNGYFIRPIKGGVRTQGLHGNNGVDLAASAGWPILAAADGTVLIAKSGGWNGGYGSYVVIQHPNGMQTLYGHMSRVDVSVGQHVTQGQTIGGMGETGQATGVHLHFEVRGGVNPF